MSRVQSVREILWSTGFLVNQWASLQQSVGAVRWRSSSMKTVPLLTVSPVRALIDEQISIKGYLLPPSSPVTMCARMHSEDNDLWEAFAHYNTDGSGSINLNSARSVGGSYVGCEPMGLFWGMQPAPGGRQGLRLRKQKVEVPYVVNISILEGHVSPDKELSELATVTTERCYMAPGVRKMEIRENGLVGTLFLPPGPGPHPALLDLWGLTGGLIEYRSALLASRGYASFSLAYVGHKDLPYPQDVLAVGDSYFKDGFQLLKDHSQVDADRVGIFGICLGGFHALRLIDEQPKCMICVNFPIGNTLPCPINGVAVPFESDQTHWKYDEEGNVVFRDLSLLSNMDPKSFVKLENVNFPLLLIVSEDDWTCFSKMNADMAAETLRSAGKSHLLTYLSYPGAGHLIEPPYMPSVRTSYWRVKPKKLSTIWGGQPAPHATAQQDAWSRTLKFLETHLRR